MRFEKRILSTVTIFLLVFSFLSILWSQPIKVSAQATGNLSGTIYDSGVDTDSDGAFNYLEVGVEVNVTSSGMFRVEIYGLLDLTYNYINIGNEIITYLDVGVQVVYLYLEGRTIYASGFNPASISSINLLDEYYNFLGSLYDTPLSRQYNCSEFDPPPASFTGTIYDTGLDTDGNGDFDYLEVSVEINVTESGNYTAEIYNLLDSSSNYIGVSGYQSKTLEVGIQTINVSLLGPPIYFSGSNPVNVSQIILSSVGMEHWLDQAYNVPLSREYSYTEFDSPFSDIDAVFIVYPSGRVIMAGELDYSDIYPPSPYPFINGNFTLQKADSTSNISADVTLFIPSSLAEASQLPFNSSDFILLSEFSGGLLTSTISGSTILPPSIASEFPLNITDFTVKGNYAGNIVSGNITVDIWNGFPLDDIVMDFKGNNTYVNLNGSTSVIFGNYPSFGELNITILEQLLASLPDTIGGQGPESLYNMTNGLLEFTMLDNTTTLHNGYATVDFEAKLEGDLIQAIVNMTDQPTYLYEVLNITCSSIESGGFLLTYAHNLRQADMNLVFVANISQLIENMIPILPDIMPSEEAAFVESILNTTIWTINEGQISLNYENSQATITATATIQDLNAELNYVKSLFLAYYFPGPWTSQTQTFNETQIDLINFSVNLNLNDTSMKVNVRGFEALPILDWINATSFRLENFFNATASEYESPREGEKLKVTIEGGSNATHTVRIFRSETVPEPDISAPGGMIWSNQSISALKDLVFQIGPLDDTSPFIDNPIQTPETPDDNEMVIVSVNVTDADTGIPPDRVTLSYRIDGGAWRNITMSKMTGNMYAGEIPGSPGGTYVEYLIVAYDYADNVAVEDKLGAYYVYTVIPEFSIWPAVTITLILTGLTIMIIAKRKWKFRSKSLHQLGHKARMFFHF